MTRVLGSIGCTELDTRLKSQASGKVLCQCTLDLRSHPPPEFLLLSTHEVSEFIGDLRMAHKKIMHQSKACAAAARTTLGPVLQGYMSGLSTILKC